MIWVITIAAFLGTLVASVSMFFIISRREQIRKALRERRRERRTPVKVGLELSSLDEPLTHEMALTENVSRQGARVITKKRWRTSYRVLVRLPRRDEQSRARIAYCDALPGDAFAIGLQFSSAVDMSNSERSVNFYRK
jgi:PilZ domain-containing protein